MVVLLDVRGTFNSIPWSVIINTMRDWGISDYLIATINEYLHDTHFTLATKEQEELEVFGGVSQGHSSGTSHTRTS